MKTHPAHVQRASLRSRLSASRIAPTFAESTVVITIIVILTVLISQVPFEHGISDSSPIVLDIVQLANAMDDFYGKYGQYPPNLIPSLRKSDPERTPSIPEADVEDFFHKAFPNNREPQELIQAIAGNEDRRRESSALQGGMSASESLFFWLRGFSDDPQYPLSGPGGPSFTDADGNNDGILDASDERLSAYNLLYRFDLNRIGPKSDKGFFDDSKESKDAGRFIEYDDPRTGVRRRINLWRYYPEGSSQPFVYFDTSRHLPTQYYPGSDPLMADEVAPFLVLRKGADSTKSDPNNVLFVKQGEFQILHAGLDDRWGDFSGIRSGTSLFPNGPFVGDLADTLSNFTVGPLEDAQE